MIDRQRESKPIYNYIRNQDNQKTIAALGFAICVALTAYGYVNSQQFMRNVHQWNVDGLKRGHTFAFVSDIHAGSAQPMEKLRDLCRQIPSVP